MVQRSRWVVYVLLTRVTGSRGSGGGGDESALKCCMTGRRRESDHDDICVERCGGECEQRQKSVCVCVCVCV